MSRAGAGCGGGVISDLAISLSTGFGVSFASRSAGLTRRTANPGRGSGARIRSISFSITVWVADVGSGSCALGGPTGGKIAGVARGTEGWDCAGSNGGPNEAGYEVAACGNSCLDFGSGDASGLLRPLHAVSPTCGSRSFTPRSRTGDHGRRVIAASASIPASAPASVVRDVCLYTSVKRTAFSRSGPLREIGT